MTELELYKWVQEKSPEWRWQYNDEAKQDDVLILPYSFHFESFSKLVEKGCDEEGIECRIKGDYFAVWMLDICEYFDINIENIFSKGGYNDF
ncbi:hypothetical protein [Sphingobacterium yanglingense]|uniref:Uncharacterized protein n=1 Tax=Sphingobacterium yanglingense TaxID=1437280 RepID=A0A4R6WN74_9SPHI|nr:hypothetical protein [Sphingobacterium yanglingense]TDQ79551.1 hypothetical protein CLV99_0994 [Sphingobacterium yanglingense]